MTTPTAAEPTAPVTGERIDLPGGWYFEAIGTDGDHRWWHLYRPDGSRQGTAWHVERVRTFAAAMAPPAPADIVEDLMSIVHEEDEDLRERAGIDLLAAIGRMGRGTADVLGALRQASVARQAEWTNGEEVSLLFRGVELGGEAGEALNVIKKLERERLGWRGSRATSEQLAEELADVVICADLIAMHPDLDIDLGAAVVAKFNATSEARGLKTRIAAPPPPPAGEPVEPSPDALREEAQSLQEEVWGRQDGGQELTLRALELERKADQLEAEPPYLVPDLRPGLERALEVIEAGEEGSGPNGRYLSQRSEGNLAGFAYVDAIRAELDRLGGAS